MHRAKALDDVQLVDVEIVTEPKDIPTFKQNE